MPMRVNVAVTDKNGAQVNKLRGGAYREAVVSIDNVRAADVAAYTALDYFGACPQSFSLDGNNAAKARLKAVVATMNAFEATPPALKIYLHSATLTAGADADPYACTDGEAATLLGIVTIAYTDWKEALAGDTPDTNAIAYITSLDIPLMAAAADTKIYFGVAVTNTYAPAQIAVTGYTETLNLRFIFEMVG